MTTDDQIALELLEKAVRAGSRVEIWHDGMKFFCYLRPADEGTGPTGTGDSLMAAAQDSAAQVDKSRQEVDKK